MSSETPNGRRKISMAEARDIAVEGLERAECIRSEAAAEEARREMSIASETPDSIEQRIADAETMVGWLRDTGDVRIERQSVRDTLDGLLTELRTTLARTALSPDVEHVVTEAEGEIDEVVDAVLRETGVEGAYVLSAATAEYVRRAKQAVRSAVDTALARAREAETKLVLPEDARQCVECSTITYGALEDCPACGKYLIPLAARSTSSAVVSGEPNTGGQSDG